MLLESVQLDAHPSLKEKTDSQETSTTTESWRVSPASAMNSVVMNLGMGCER